MIQQVVEYQQPQELALPDSAYLQREFQAVREFQRIVHEFMVSGQDYGVIPGTNKPTLLKPGAEKITKLLGLADTYEVTGSIEDWTRPLFHYQVKCRLVSLKTGTVVAEGLGECNSMESHYRWRNRERACPECGVEAIIKGREEFGGGFLCFKRKGGCNAKFPENSPLILDQPIGKVENEDVYSLVNTILKMAKKRAQVDAALSVGRLSEVFTQDMEDLSPAQPVGVEAPQKEPSSQPPRRTVTQPTPKTVDTETGEIAAPSAAPEPPSDWVAAFDGAGSSEEVNRLLKQVPRGDSNLPEVKAAIQRAGARLRTQPL